MQLIETSISRVKQGTDLADQAKIQMNLIVESIQQVTTLAGEISVASTEQADGVAQIGEAVSHMDTVTQQNAALVEQMAAAAEGLRGQAHELVSLVSKFKV